MIKSEENKLRFMNVNEKQKIVLMLIYITNALPIQALRFFENIITNSNLTYKIIPPLEKNGLIVRKNYGYNKYGQKEILLKGKALYDTLILTRLGTSYVQGVLGVPENCKVLHEYYGKTNFRIDINMEERFKRNIMTDIIFRKDIFLCPSLSTNQQCEGI